MRPEDEEEIGRALKAALRKARGYADYFGWGPDRDLEEWGVLTSFAESLMKASGLFFGSLKVRGRGSDPPDLEGLDSSGRRIAFEVTELVDGEAIRAYKAGHPYPWAEWTREKFLNELTSLLRVKNAKFPKLLDPPYPGGYVVVVFTDEPDLQRAAVAEFLRDHTFARLDNVHRAFLVLSYDPRLEHCPYYELAKSG